MNYNRRSTRPDSLFYRETRKLRSPPGRGSGIHPLAIVVAVAALTALIWWLFMKKP